MAKTAAQAINIVKRAPKYRDLNDQGIAASAADAALKLMWNAYPWQGSESELPPFYMTPFEPDHKQPNIKIPTDFQFLVDIWIRELFGKTYELSVRHRLPISAYFDRPGSICYIPEDSAFRLHPSPSSGMAAPNFQVEGVYKKATTEITDSTLSTTSLPFNDRFFPVYQEALRYQYANILGQPDAGSVQVSGSFITRTGLLGKFHAALEEAIGDEVTSQGQETVHPQFGIMIG